MSAKTSIADIGQLECSLASEDFLKILMRDRRVINLLLKNGYSWGVEIWLVCSQDIEV
jgi:hypothetical protein